MEEIITIDPLFFPILLRCAIASLCGVFVGMERAYRAKPAGVRTHMLISLGSCLFMGVSLVVAKEARLLGYTTPDPARIAAQVVTGIGFLGAGAIIRNRGFVKGMTSAATIWCMSAIGLAAGAGMLLTAIISSIGLVFILRLFDFLEKKMRIKRFRVMTLDVIIKKEGIISEIRNQLRAMEITLSHERISHIVNEIHYQSTLLFHGDLENKIEKKIKNVKGVKDLVILTPGELWEA